MTPDDELERELASYRPRPASPELKRHVRRRLKRRPILVLAALSAVAASITVSVVLNRPPLPTPVVPDGGLVRILEPGAPSVLAYRQASSSPQSFEAFLDQQAVRSAEHGAPVRAASFTFRGPRE